MLRGKFSQYALLMIDILIKTQAILKGIYWVFLPPYSRLAKL
jgi:hypothetical protein